MGSNLPPRLASPRGDHVTISDTTRLNNLRSFASDRQRLVQLLGINPATLAELTHSTTLYTEFEIEKNGKKRGVQAPRDDLKAVQKRIADLLARIRPEEYLYCPAKRRSYVSNAARHKDSRVVRCLDITKFFPNTPSRRVYWFFARVMQCAGDIAGILAKLATYNSCLPTGSPLSPIMAHYAYIDVWRAIADLTKESWLLLTVYVDDITVSGAHVPDHLIWRAKQIIHASGLRYHKEKKYVDNPAEVTGVILRDGKMSLPNRQHLKMHKAKVDSRHTADEIEKSKLATRIRGLRAQQGQIERQR